MSLAAGTRFGPYQIVDKLGAGGMGEVYRARDTRLDRTVAIKVLPAELSDDPTLRERFEREARVISQLTHPHICTLYDVGSESTGSGQTDFLVMEYLEGETLAERLQRGAIPANEALRIARDVMDALDRAHRRGIVHRDLKPGNLFLVKSEGSTPATVKLLDFGLARTAPKVAVPGATGVATSPAPLTQHGTVLGTFQYMSPEQLEGKDADARSDLFSFGTVLYEMITGRRAFEAASQAGLMAAILDREPAAIGSEISHVPLGLDRIIKTCLAKNPDERFQTAHDLRLQLRWLEADEPVGTSAMGSVRVPSTRIESRRDRIAIAGVAGLVVGAAVALLATWLNRSVEVPERPPTRFTIQPPTDLNVLVSGNQGVLAVSRDGRVIASIVEPRRQLFIRFLDRPDGKILQGIDNAAWPFFSPDGRSIGFFVGSQLQRVSVDGGRPATIGNVPPTSAVWLDDQTIVIGQNSGGLLRIPASGGVAQPLLELEPGEVQQIMPEIVPGTDVLLYTSGSAGDPRVMALRLDTLQRQLILERGARPQYSSSGHLLFGDANQIMAAPFDLSTLTVSGAPVRVVESVSFASPANPLYASAPTGTLIYLSAGASTKRSLAWVDRQGRTIGNVAIAPRQFEQPQISPDGTRVAVATREAGTQDVWLVDLSRSVASKFSFNSLEDETPVWAADGSRVFFKSNQEPRQKAANGSGVDEPLGPHAESHVHLSRNVHLASASPDGKYLAVNSVNGPTGEDVEIVGLGSQVTLTKFAASEANEVAPRFSPDGRWIAYQSDESGQQEIYVQAFPGPGGKWQVSKAGGTEAVWARSGKELFYRAGRAMMSVPIETSSTFTPGSPTKLFEGNFESGHRFHPNYDVAADGSRFLVIVRDGLAPAVSVNVEIDLHGELRRLTQPTR